MTEHYAQHSWYEQCAVRRAYALCRYSNVAKAGMELTVHHHTDNNISHHSLESRPSVQNVMDD